jgi:hypothetical protein
MNKALAIITYARSDYFELVLHSILNQTIKNRSVSDFYDIYIFQDGLYEGESAVNIAGHERISCLLEKIPKSIAVFKQRVNLGVALHFDFIERLLFVDKGYDFVVFCEDDLILAPGYMSAIDMMAEKFHDDPRVGMVSAHPSNPTIPLEQQRANKNKFATMGHNWGFGLSRTFWEKRQPFVDCYLELIRDVPYRKRNSKVIFEWLKKCGFNPAASSQDHIKNCATFALGALKLSTFPNFGLPIGRTGLHCTTALFKKMGFDKTVVFDQELDVIADLDDTQFISIYSQSARQVCEKFAQAVRDPKKNDIQEWQARLIAGEFHPKKIMPEFFETKSQSFAMKTWKPSDIPTRPHLEPEGMARLEARLREASIYLEYGAGGSTVMAAEMGVKEIHSIDSDKGFLDAVQRKIAESRSGSKICLHHVDIGPTKDWGHPTDRTFANRWPKYCVAGWDLLLSQDRRPDLILIDGRFRVASFLASLLLSKPGTIILFDDYLNRPHYHIVEKHIKVSATAGRMAEFIVEYSFSPSQVVLDLMLASTDPA